MRAVLSRNGLAFALRQQIPPRYRLVIERRRDRIPRNGRGIVRRIVNPPLQATGVFRMGGASASAQERARSMWVQTGSLLDKVDRVLP